MFSKKIHSTATLLWANANLGKVGLATVGCDQSFSLPLFLPFPIRGREQKLLLHVTPYLFFDDEIWVGIDKNTSAVATDMTRCLVSVTMSTLDAGLGSRRSKASTLPCSWMTLLEMITQMIFLHLGIIPATSLVSFLSSGLALSIEKLTPVEPDLD